MILYIYIELHIYILYYIYCIIYIMSEGHVIWLGRCLRPWTAGHCTAAPCMTSLKPVRAIYIYI